MRCIKCGNEMPDNDLECAACGTKVSEDYNVVGQDAIEDVNANNINKQQTDYKTNFTLIKILVLAVIGFMIPLIISKTIFTGYNEIYRMLFYLYYVFTLAIMALVFMIFDKLKKKNRNKKNELDTVLTGFFRVFWVTIILIIIGILFLVFTLANPSNAWG